MKTSRPTLLILVSLLLTHCASLVSERSSLPALMVERLHWMDEVAQVKQARGLPVADQKREAELLDAMTKQGIQAGIPEQATRAFFLGQINAAKRYQEAWLRSHAMPSSDTTPLPDLAQTVRPALDEIGRRMIESLAKTRKTAPRANTIADGAACLTRAGFAREVVEAAVRGLEDGLR